MDATKLKEIIDLHGKWLRSEAGGSRANLSGADLGGAYLRSANLSGADLGGAYLRSANLSGADLRGAYLRSANLSGANLRSANLSDADLRGADLRGADLTDSKLPHFQIVPTGTLVGWKKLRNGIVAKLEIPLEAKRTSSLVGRKCRAEFVKVLELSKGESACDKHTGQIEYRVGRIVRPDKYNPDIRIECTHGIHFFVTREEAEEYE